MHNMRATHGLGRELPCVARRFCQQHVSVLPKEQGKQVTCPSIIGSGDRQIDISPSRELWELACCMPRGILDWPPYDEAQPAEGTTHRDYPSSIALDRATSSQRSCM
jgi:hypothetical protein